VDSRLYANPVEFVEIFQMSIVISSFPRLKVRITLGSRLSSRVILFCGVQPWLSDQDSSCAREETKFAFTVPEYSHPSFAPGVAKAAFGSLSGFGLS